MPDSGVDFSQAKQLIAKKEIVQSIEKLAATINQDFVGQDVVVLCVMNGGMVFCSHLLTHLSFSVRFDYVHVSRYGDKDHGGQLRWIKEPSINLDGQNILIVDDMIDEGVSLTELVNFCHSKNALSVKAAVLLNKEKPRKHSDIVEPDYYGFAIQDKFVYGFGIDYKHYYRNAENIYFVESGSDNSDKQL